MTTAQYIKKVGEKQFRMRLLSHLSQTRGRTGLPALVPTRLRGDIVRTMDDGPMPSSMLARNKEGHVWHLVLHRKTGLYAEIKRNHYV